MVDTDTALEQFLHAKHLRQPRILLLKALRGLGAKHVNRALLRCIAQVESAQGVGALLALPFAKGEHHHGQQGLFLESRNKRLPLRTAPGHISWSGTRGTTGRSTTSYGPACALTPAASAASAASAAAAATVATAAAAARRR